MDATKIAMDVVNTERVSPPESRLSGTMRFLILKYKCVLILALALLLFLDLVNRVIESAAEGESVRVMMTAIIEILKNATQTASEMSDLRK